MHTANPWKSYRQVKTLTAPPAQIILMMFDGVLLSLERSLTGFSISDPAQANMAIHNNLQHAQEIIRHLNGALNMEQGGDIANELRRLYDYFGRRLKQSNVRKEKAGILEVIRHVTVLRDAWAKMLEKQEAPADEQRQVFAVA